MNLSPSQRFDLERLISIQLDGEPTDDEVLRLENLLRGDAECRRHYLRFVDLHAQLLQHPGLALLSPPPSGPPVAGSLIAGPLGSGPSPLSVRAAWRPYLFTALIASAVSLLTQYLWMRPAMNVRPLTPASVATAPTSVSPRASSTPAPIPNYFATFVSVENCQWVAGDDRRAGMRLGLELLRLKSGRVTIRFDGGSLLTLDGAAELRVVAADSAFLARGRALLRSEASADPFDLLTPHARWSDSGSEFALIVDQQAEEVHVLRGELMRTSSSPAEAKQVMQTLAAGQARRYDSSSAVDGIAVPFNTEWMRTTSTIVGKLKADKQRGLLAYDSFDPAGPFAWRGAWALHDPDSTAGIFQTVGGLRHATMPGTSMSSGAGFLKNRVAVSRLAPFTLPTDVDGAYYFSFLTRAERRPTEGEPCFVQLSFRRLSDQEPRRRLAATVSWSRSSISIGWDGAGQHASVPLDFSRTYLVVGKILVSASGPDQAFVRLYGTKDRLPLDEPLSWTVSSRPVMSRSEFDLVQWSSMSEFGIAVDELRLGTNWNSVAEPYQQELELLAPASLRIPSSRSKGRPTVQID